MTAEKSTTNKVPETTQSATATSGSEKMDAAVDYQKNIKQWFLSLSPEERAAALGFKDDPWTALWTQVVRASSLSTASHNQGDAPESSNDISSLEKGSNEVPWDARISIDVIEKAWASVIGEKGTTADNHVVDKTKLPRTTSKGVQGQKGSAVVADNTMVAKQEKASVEEDNDNTKSSGAADSKNENDAYRIRTESKLEPSKSSAEKKDEQSEKPESSQAPQPSASADVPTATIPIDTASTSTFNTEIMNSIIAVFPSVFKFASTSHTAAPAPTAETYPGSASHTSTHTPFITLHPTYTASMSGDDLLLSMDEIVATVPSINNSKESFMDLVRKAATRPSAAAETKATPSMSIPIYLLVLLRFKVSLAESFASRAGANSGEKDDFKGLLTRITGSIGAADPAKVKKIVAKLESDLRGFPGDQSLEKLLLLPFQHVTQLLSSSDKQYVSMLQTVDSAYDDSVLHKLGSSSRDIAAAKSPVVGDRGVEIDTHVEATTTGEATVPQPEETPNDPNNGTGAKKSKKRKNKKKKKKSAIDAAGAGNGGGSDVVKQQPQPQPDKAEQHNAEKASHQSSSGSKEVAKELQKEKNSSEVAGELQKEKKSANVEKKEAQPLESAHPAEIVHSSPTAIEPSASEANQSPKEQEKAPKEVEMEAPATKATDPARPNHSQVSPPEKDTSSPAAADAKVSLQQPKEKPSSDAKKPKEEPTSHDKKPKQNSEAAPLVEDDQWETVGARPRDRRKKGPSTASARPAAVQGTGNAPNATNQQGGNTKKKNHKRRKAARKFVAGILNSVLDKVEEEVQRKRSLSRDRMRPNAHNAPSLAGWNIGNVNRQPTSSSAKLPQQQQKASTMRDVLIGETGKASNMSYSDRASQKTVKSHGKTGVASANGAPADQNTVPTIPETLSGAPRDQKARSEDSSSGDSLEAQKSQSHVPSENKDTSPSPPLPTLLSPGNNNSSSSSVASSLDAPNDVLPDPKENEVGYHLLGVCKRLSNEIDLFMRRRDDALAVRRHERGLVLSALEETLAGIWPGMCSVEMYGSCATNLDLPSSDLDVVVCGLDRPIELVQSPSNATSSVESTAAGDNSVTEDDKTQEDDAMGRVNSQQEMSQYSSDQQHYSPHQSPMHHNMNMMYPQMSVNAERVMRLTMELEQQPWAVHVKAIPTASVPVIKILADPARLSGAMGTSNEWLVQHRIPAHSAPDSSDGKNSNQSPVAHFAAQEAPPLWRGADVVNGLLKVDITFEGPEHGGIGSTKFSAQAVQDFAAERGVAPEATPAVQALMVLKELLAQRRLNEPFSGGMSSYALLLLVISVIRERSIIREELEKAERQRRVVAAGGGNSALRSPDKNKKAKDPPAKPEDGHSKQVSEKTKSFAVAAMESAKKSSLNEVPNNRVKDADAKSGKSEAVTKNPKSSNAPSSWANIARKNKEDQTKPLESDKNQDAAKVPDKDLKKPSSFADAVAKGASSQPSGQVVPQQKKPAAKGQRRDDTAQQRNKKSRDKGGAVESAKPLNGEQQGNDNVKQVAGQESSDKENPSRGSSPTQSELAGPDPSLFPQGFDDVVEVLCSGETTPGKLLMHFLLFYGQHFDSQSTAIDFSGTHQRDANANLGYSVRSPYLQRRSAGNYDPVTGMLTVDPIVVYDPLVGAESNNVARSCFAWSSIRWLFAQSYMTLSSTVEMNATQATNANRSTHKDGPAYGHDKTGNVVVDPNSPLLELLLSF